MHDFRPRSGAGAGIKGRSFYCQLFLDACCLNFIYTVIGSLVKPALPLGVVNYALALNLNCAVVMTFCLRYFKAAQRAFFIPQIKPAPAARGFAITF